MFLNTLNFKIDGQVEKVDEEVIKDWVPIEEMNLKELASNFSVKLDKVPNLPKQLGLTVKLREPPLVPTLSFESDVPDGVQIVMTVIGLVMLVMVSIFAMVRYRRNLVKKAKENGDRGMKPKPRLFAKPVSTKSTSEIIKE